MLMTHRVTLTDEELQALADRLVPICPADYDLPTYSILRSLYGRFTWLLNKPNRRHQPPER
ncbi:hypothetical protein ES708_17907 [subsurface metagenome]